MGPPLDVLQGHVAASRLVPYIKTRPVNWYRNYVMWVMSDMACDMSDKWTLFFRSRRDKPKKVCVRGYVCYFVVFNGLAFSLNWVFTLIAVHQKENAVQCRLEWFFFWRAKTNNFIAKHVHVRRFVCDCSFLGVLILEWAWPVWWRKRDDLHLLNTWDGQLLFCPRTGLWITLALGCQPWLLIWSLSGTQVFSSKTSFYALTLPMKVKMRRE